MGRVNAWIAIATVVAGMLVLAGAAPAAPIVYGAPAWWSYNRPADYTTVTSNIYVTMPDATPIHCLLAQPAKNGVAASGRFPALIEEYLPYGGVGALGDLPGGDDFWADHGYVAMSCDVRGTGLSGGVWQGLLSAQENQDNYDLLEWMRRQPWSNGRLGQMGGSYGGMTSMRVASLDPPGLLAISPLSSEYDLYDENIYPGGIKTTPGTGDDWPVITVALSGGREIAAYTYAQYAEHPLWDSFWQQISIMTRWNRIKVPVLGISAYNDDLVPGGAPANWIGLQKAGNPQNYMIVGPWGHDTTTSSEATLPAGAQLAWFDRWVMGLKSAPLPSSPVTSFEQPTPGAGRGWESFSSWPPPQDQTEDWALNPGNSISPAPSSAGTESYTTLPSDAGYTGVNNNGAVSPTQRPPVDGIAGESEVFDSAPLTEPLAIAGTVVVRLRASLSYTDGNFMVLLYDVAPNGTATFLQEGMLKASHRFEVNGAPVPVTPGAVNDFPIEIFPVHWRFAAGHRLRLMVYGGESTWLVPEPVPVTTKLSLGRGGSTVSLPVLGNGERVASRTVGSRPRCRQHANKKKHGACRSASRRSPRKPKRAPSFTG